MSVELNKETILKTLENGINAFTREKKFLNNNLEELDDYLSGYLINLPNQSNELKSLVKEKSKKINEKFSEAIGLLKNINNRVTNLFSNIFINIDLSNLKNLLSNSFLYVNEIVLGLPK